MSGKEIEQCPACGSKDVIPIQYGYPGPEMYKEYEEGKIFLGGCCIDIGNPGWYCRDCEHKW